MSKLPRHVCDQTLDVPQFILGAAAIGAGIEAGTLKSWVYREPKILALGYFDQDGSGTGNKRLFTLRRVRAAAIAAELVTLGLISSRAGAIANFFMDEVIPAFDQRLGPNSLVFLKHAEGVTVAESIGPEQTLVVDSEVSSLWVNYSKLCRRVMVRLASVSRRSALVD